MVTAAVVEAVEAQKMMVENALRDALRGGHCAGASGVAGAMEYAVLGSGQRLRPLLAMRVAGMVGGDYDVVLRGAVAVAHG